MESKTRANEEIINVFIYLPGARYLASQCFMHFVAQPLEHIKMKKICIPQIRAIVKFEIFSLHLCLSIFKSKKYQSTSNFLCIKCMHA